MSHPSSKLGGFLTNCSHLSELLKDKEAELIKLLAQYETYETARDEIKRSIDTLDGIDKELSNISHPLNNINISTFFPLNLPIYSLVLFGIAPSAFAKNVFIRPPEVMQEILKKLWLFLEIDKLFSNISLQPVPRHIFMSLYASESDVIIFTGKYENAQRIQQQCPQALLVYNGSGINPFVIFKDADIKLAARKAVEMRCFNSGQDCAGPDAFFVHSSLKEQFIQELKAMLQDVKVGDSRDSSIQISRIIKETYIDQVKDWLQKEKEHLVYGGKINEKKHYVYPAIISKPLAEHQGSFHEFFAPFFYVLNYDTLDELRHVIFTPQFTEKTMYISVFGNNKALEKKLTFAKVLKNKIVNDVEHGNQEYGGYGSRANFVLYGNQMIVKPILISRDMHMVLT